MNQHVALCVPVDRGRPPPYNMCIIIHRAARVYRTRFNLSYRPTPSSERVIPYNYV